MSTAPSGTHAGQNAGARALSRRLQEGTREVHEWVERTASFNRLIVIRLPGQPAGEGRESDERVRRARVDYLEVYRRFLIASHGFEAAVDAALADSPALAHACSLGFPPERHASTALIRDDLRTLFGEDSLAALGRMAGLAPVRTLTGFVGTEYVRRGSRAGGAFIASIVRQNLGLTPATGASFLMQYGKETKGVIAAFKDWVDGLPLSRGDADVAVATAIATFETVQAWHALLEARFAEG